MRSILARLLLLCALASFLPACGERASSDAEPDGAAADTSTTTDSEDTPKTPRERSTTVNAARVVRGDLVLPVIAEGTIRARRSAEIQAEVAGRVKQVVVEEGQRVRRGQILLSIDDREYLVNMDEARSEYLRSLSRLAVEEGRLEGYDASEGDSLVLQLEAKRAELDAMENRGELTHEQRQRRELELEYKALQDGTYRQSVALARSGLATARAAVERARLNLERTSIVAPFSGVISGLELTAGEYVHANQVLLNLVDNVDIEAEVGVLESDLRGIEVGRSVLLEVSALKDTLQVSVDVISPQVDRESRTCRILLRLRNDEGRLRPGMFVRAAIAGEILPDRLLVPREAILTREGRPLLFKVEEDRAKWLYVNLGRRNDSLVEIQSVLQGGKLEPGDLVIVSDHLTLPHEAKIKVRKTLDPKDPWAAP